MGHNLSGITGGIFLITLGSIILYTIERRQFNRRAITGLQIFRSFERALIITLVEKIGQSIGKLLIIAGGTLLVFYSQ